MAGARSRIEPGAAGAGVRRWPSDPVELLRLVYPSLLRIARLLDGLQSGEDLVQDALVETLARHPGFEGIEHPLGYTRTVLFRLAFSRRRARREVPADVGGVLERDPVLDHADAVADRVLVERGLLGVGPRQRACLVLRYWYGMDDGEIAAVLGCGASTARSQIARGLARARRSLGSDGEERT